MCQEVLEAWELHPRIWFLSKTPISKQGLPDFGTPFLCLYIYQQESSTPIFKGHGVNLNFF